MVGKYLSQLEREKFIDEKVNTPPPEFSSFYWNNCYKYKAFIPTQNRRTYFNLEEYDAYDIMCTNLEVNDWWRLAKRNVCLALNRHQKNKKDIKVLSKMEKLKICLLKKRNQLRRDKKKNDQFSIPLGSCKYYVLLVYDVKDIKNVEDKDRYKHAKICERMWLSNEDQKLIDLIDDTFEVIARRFAKDSKRVVYCYKRTI